MERRTLLTAGGFVLASVTAAAAQPRPDRERGRTYYDRLALDTPDEAAAIFVSAYAAADYATVWLVFSLDTQRLIETAVMEFSFDRLLASPASGNPDIFREAVPALDQWEQSDIGWLFDHVMQVGARHGALPIALDADAVLTPSTGEPPRVDIADRSGPITLRLARSAAGRWRVRSAMPPSRNPDRPPWGLPLSD